MNKDTGYDELVDRISHEAILDFKQAASSIDEQRKACCRYLKCGIHEGLSQEELIDFLGISSPSILSLAGYTEEEEITVMELLGEISDYEIAN